MHTGPAIAVASLLALSSLSSRTADSSEPGAVERGQYLVTIMECAGCHTTGALRGQRQADHHLAGSEVGYGGPAPEGAANPGAVFPPNLTPDAETGLGRWTDDQILKAIRFGRRPDGRTLSPVMPWPIYGGALTDADARAIVAYLRSIPAVRLKAPDNFSPGEPPTGPYLIIHKR